MAVKQRLSVYLDADMMARLEELASKEHAAKSSIAEAAIISFLTADDADRWEAAVTRRLDRLTRSVDRVERDLESSVEALALYVRAWLTARRLCRKAHKPRHRPRGESDMRASLGLWDGGWHAGSDWRRRFWRTFSLKPGRHLVETTAFDCHYEIRARDIGWGTPDLDWGHRPLDVRKARVTSIDTGAKILLYLYDTSAMLGTYDQDRPIRRPAFFIPVWFRS